MKKYVKYLAGILLLACLAFLMQCHVPYFASNVYEKIKPGMKINEVTSLVNEGTLKPNTCLWSYGDEEKVLASEKHTCNIPGALNLEKKNIALYVLYMGPGYQHNDFTVYFSSGLTSEITDMRHWD
jgi:hypothetical protein